MNIEYLADHMDVIAALDRWFHEEWGYLYSGRTLESVKWLIEERAYTRRIPLALLARDGEELLGTVCLKVHDMDTRHDLTPWLAGLYVAAPRRRQGIGARLVKAIEQQTGEPGMERLYRYTPECEAFYAKFGWQVMERMDYHGYPVSLMQKGILLREQTIFPHDH